MVCSLVPPSLKSKSFFGFIILMIVNILWVLSGEITRYIFIDCNFNRPFFVLSVKSSFLSIYFIRYLYKPKKIQYTSMDEIDEMSIEGFEEITDDENENEGRKVRFSSTKEIRRLPLRIGREAELARRSYDSSANCTIPRITSPTLIMICVLLPTWIISSLSYHASLLFTTLSSLNLISATSSIFVLILSLCIPYSGSKVTSLKGFIVLINLFGVSLISQSDSLSSSSIMLALFSSFAYAVYLISLSKYVSVYGDIDINFLFGTIGIVSIIISVFLLPVLDWTSIERLHPLPRSSIWIRLILSTILGTIIADRLWMEGTLLTSSLISSISTSLSIPISFVMDSLLRNEYPSPIELIAAIPITFSFIGAIILESESTENIAKKTSMDSSMEQESLIENEQF